MNAKTSRITVLLIFFLLSAGFTVTAQSYLVLCDAEPSDTSICYEDVSSWQYLEVEGIMDDDGNYSFSLEKTLYFILWIDDDEADYAHEVIFELYDITDAEEDTEEFLDSYSLQTESGWNYSWYSWTFYDPGQYKVKTFIDDDFVEGTIFHIDEESEE